MNLDRKYKKLGSIIYPRYTLEANQKQQQGSKDPREEKTQHMSMNT